MLVPETLNRLCDPQWAAAAVEAGHMASAEFWPSGGVQVVCLGDVDVW